MEKIRILFPNFYTGENTIKFKLSIQLLLNRHLIFCGKISLQKAKYGNCEVFKILSKQKKLDRLINIKKYKIKVAMKDLSILKNLKNKKINYYEIFYLIQCFQEL